VRTTPRPVQPVRLLHGSGVELQRVFRIQSSRRLGHTDESKAPVQTPTAILGRRMDVLAHQALGALATAGRRIAGQSGLSGALSAVADAAVSAAGADVAVVRIADPGGDLRLRAVAARSEAVEAELQGSWFAAAELPREEIDDLDELPPAVRAAARRVHANAVHLLPVWIAGRPAACLEVMRTGDDFGLEELTLARVVASQLSLALVAFGGRNGSDLAPASPEHALGIAGEALAAGQDETRVANQITHLAGEATGAQAAQLWRLTAERELVPLVSTGALGAAEASDTVAQAARRGLEEQSAVTVALDETLPQAPTMVTVRLGNPPLGVLQLFFSTRTPPSKPVLDGLGSFGVRAAHALRASERATEMSADLERTESLLAVVGQAIAHLSLTHTLDTVAERITELLRVDRIAVYLRDQGRLHAAYERGLIGPHETVAERLLELSLGPSRAQGMLHVTDAAADLRLGTVRDALVEAGIEGVVAVPLLVREELIGIVAVYLPLGHVPSPSESALLAALASQLAVAVQNARLHEDVKRLAAERERALDAEAARARQLTALHEITSSFATSLSLDATLDAVVRAAVDLLGVDAAVIRLPEERGDQLVVRAGHVPDLRLADALLPLLERPQQLESLPGRRLFRMGKPLVLDAESARRLGASYELLVPFLEQGSTAAVIPIATPAELLATLTVVSLDPGRRIGREAIETALAVGGQAALAIDNARLYQQQKRFSDTMQRSLLPQHLPDVSGLEVGAVYESSARVEVGGDVYDFLVLPDGRLAAVLGDVAGHGIEATADMALAKFVFRSLAREHPEPGEFLAHANEVAHEELVGGKFITMLYLAVDPKRNEVAAARAGHPPARLIDSSGKVTQLSPQGLPLGVDVEQHYEEIREPFPPGTTVCIYTDGLVEARAGDEQYGVARLDAALAAGRDLSAQELAEQVVADCRAFGGGELVDDCAIVVIRRR
jgi:serine phosphatase RsbU (regulator of sigma subunit)